MTNPGYNYAISGDPPRMIWADTREPVISSCCRADVELTEVRIEKLPWGCSLATPTLFAPSCCKCDALLILPNGANDA